jgi:hypothetical protein
MRLSGMNVISQLQGRDKWRSVVRGGMDLWVS